MKELEEKIFNFIEEKYCAKFTGIVKVDFDGEYFCLHLHTQSWMVSMDICWQGEGEIEFFEYIKKELTKRNLSATGFFNVKLEHGEDSLR